MALAVLLALQLQVGQASPSTVVALATRAVEGDSVAVLARHWSGRLARDSTDLDARLGLATLARLSYDYAAADSGFAAITRALGPDALAHAATAHLEAGRSFQIRGMNVRADSAYFASVIAARRARSAAIEASGLIALAALRSRTIGPIAADTLLWMAGHLVADDQPVRADYLCARAALLQMSGQPGVEAHAREGASVALAAGARRQHAFCRRVLALALIERDAEVGFEILQEVVEELTDARDHAGLASVLQWRGYRQFVQHAYGPARADLLRAVEEGRRSGARSPVAWAVLNLAQVSAWASDPLSARQYADSAEVLLRGQADLWGLGTLPALRGDIARLVGDRTAARGHLRAGLEAAQALGYPPAIVSFATALTSLELDDRNATDAARWLGLARRVARDSHLPGWDRGLTHEAARLALFEGRLEEAEMELRRGLEGLRNAQPAVEYRWRARLAEALMRQNRPGEAESELRLAFAALDSARAGLSDQEARARVLQSLHGGSDDDVGIPGVLARLVAAGRPEASFELAERARARGLLERMVVRDELNRHERGRTPAPLLEAAPSVASSDIIAALPPESALLEYVTGVGDTPTTLFILSRAGLHARELGALAALAPDLRRFMTMIEAGERPDEIGRVLEDALVAPARAVLDSTVTHLIIVADVGLHRLAFDALTLPDGRTVAERFVVSYAPSAAVAARLLGMPRREGPADLVAFGDPRFSSDVAAGFGAPGREAFESSGGLPRLEASAREVRTVSRYADRATVRLREAASEAYLLGTSLSGFRVLHFATHALVDEHTPMRTALALSPGEGADGLVTGAELASLVLDADMVVLSACRTAGGAFVPGEGIEGLTGPLIEAGVRSVVASLWRVADRSTADFMARFYAELAAGLATGEALATAKRASIAAGEPPSVWAAFTLVGDPTLVLGLERGRDPRAATIAIGLLGLAVAYGLIKRRRRSSARN